MYGAVRAQVVLTAQALYNMSSEEAYCIDVGSWQYHKNLQILYQKHKGDLTWGDEINLPRVKDCNWWRNFIHASTRYANRLQYPKLHQICSAYVNNRLKLICIPAFLLLYDEESWQGPTSFVEMFTASKVFYSKGKSQLENWGIEEVLRPQSIDR